MNEGYPSMLLAERFLPQYYQNPGKYIQVFVLTPALLWVFAQRETLYFISGSSAIFRLQESFSAEIVEQSFTIALLKERRQKSKTS
jgi:hypothetical protein